MGAPLDASALAALRGRSLLTTADWTLTELDQVLAVARAFAERDRAGRSNALLPDRLAYAMFFDNSTRTKSAWAGAAARLGMHPVIVDGSSTQVAHGETAAETGAMIGMNAHALGVRHDLILGEGNRFMREVRRGLDDYLAATGDSRPVPLVNLQCDLDHPTQTLADLLHLQDRLGGSVAGRRITVSWASSPSYAKPLSVPQGLISLLTRFGAHVTLAHPTGYGLVPEVVARAQVFADAAGGSLTLRESPDASAMDEAFTGAEVVYPKSWGPYDLMAERVDANRRGDAAALVDIERRALEQNGRHTDWICDERRMALTADAAYLHCLPADIGSEVAASVIERFRHSLGRQAQWKLYVIMALVAVASVDELADRLGARA